ncbi:hypothetical protein CSC94_02995 [Zhengella mangrovi]|uniref:DUF4864 domain-containing protein n=1 Tax=Zhengella mangrovi TaxID=1982044 RepID=A0A2G1QU25_9HYPH|nr:hypothetical protein [Zhengella mangrovi]PHP68969.1 hypothetical protein CSC94_02995 [Zhengella mangrovi]
MRFSRSWTAAAVVLAAGATWGSTARAQISVATAMAGDPLPEICAFASSLGEGTEAVVEQLGVMASPWGESDRAKLGPIMRPELDKFRMEAGVVYRIANLAPFSQEYLVVSADRNEGQTVYFRIIYETGPKGYYFKNVNFNSDFYTILKGGLVQPPEQMTCG